MGRAITSTKGKVVVGISEFETSNQEGDIIVTFSLGSCLGITLYDPEARVGGMIHAMLPLAKGKAAADRYKVGMFVDSGLVALMDAMLARGARMDRLIVKMAGAASTMDESGRFQIGQRNVVVARKLLWKNSLMISGEDVGGSVPRTMRLYIDTGVTTVTRGEECEI